VTRGNDGEANSTGSVGCFVFFYPLAKKSLMSGISEPWPRRFFCGPVCVRVCVCACVRLLLSSTRVCVCVRVFQKSHPCVNVICPLTEEALCIEDVNRRLEVHTPPNQWNVLEPKGFSDHICFAQSPPDFAQSPPDLLR